VPGPLPGRSSMRAASVSSHEGVPYARSATQRELSGPALGRAHSNPQGRWAGEQLVQRAGRGPISATDVRRASAANATGERVRPIARWRPAVFLEPRDDERGNASRGREAFSSSGVIQIVSPPGIPDRFGRREREPFLRSVKAKRPAGRQRPRRISRAPARPCPRTRASSRAGALRRTSRTGGGGTCANREPARQVAGSAPGRGRRRSALAVDGPRTRSPSSRVIKRPGPATPQHRSQQRDPGADAGEAAASARISPGGP